MMFSVALDVALNVAGGLTLWETQRSFRQLIIRRNEQQFLYAQDIHILLASFNANIWKSLSSLFRGQIGRVFSQVMSYSHYLLFCITLIFMYGKEKFDGDNEKIARLRRRFPTIDFAHAPGAAIVRECAGRGESLILESQFPKENNQDPRTIDQRIDVINERVNSRLTRTFYSVGDFLLMHVADIVIFVTLAYAGITMYWGGNFISSFVQLLFCLLCIAEQKPFWMNPTYNEGPLCNTWGGALFRTYLSVISSFHIVKIFMYYTNYGPIGKISAFINLVSYLLHRFFFRGFARCLDAIIQWVYNFTRWVDPLLMLRFDPLFQPVYTIGRQWRGKVILAPQTLFTPFECLDARPQTELQALEKELLTHVATKCQESAEFRAMMSSTCLRSAQQSNAEVLDKLMGKEEDFGIFSKHVNIQVSGAREALERESKTILHICISALERGNTDPLISLIDCAHDFHSCSVAVARTISDFCLDLLSTSFGQECTNTNSLPLNEHYRTTPRLVSFQVKVFQIFQQLRNRILLEHLQQQHAEVLSNREIRAEENTGIQHGWYERITRFFIHMFQKHHADMITNEHTVTMIRSALSQDLGLITHFGDAHADFALKRAGDNSPILTFLTTKLIRVFGKQLLMTQCAATMVPELEEVLVNDADHRLNMDDLYFAKQALLDDPREKDQLEATYLSIMSNKPVRYASSETTAIYKREKERFIEQHLIQVLVELGLLEDPNWVILFE